MSLASSFDFERQLFDDINYRPQGDDLKVTYIVKIALNGSMPSALVSMIVSRKSLNFVRIHLFSRDTDRATLYAGYRDSPLYWTSSRCFLRSYVAFCWSTLFPFFRSSRFPPDPPVGYPPYVDPAVNVAPTTVTFQTEHFSEVPAAEKGPLEYRCAFTTAAGATFDILYDNKKMYADGINAVVEGTGAEVTDDGEGRVSVKCTSAGEAVVVVIGPK